MYPNEVEDNNQSDQCQQENCVIDNNQLSQDDQQTNDQLKKFIDKIVILLVGGTGVGKSLLGNQMAKILGCQQDNFKVGHSQESCTQECSYYEFDKFVIIDTPGVFDTTQNNDEEHVRNMVNYLKKVTGHINVIVFVFNGQVKRFDQSQKTILKLFMASMGYEAIHNIGLFFTHLPQTEKSKTVAKEKEKIVADEFRNLGIKDVGENLPFWFVDNDPEVTNEMSKEQMEPEKWHQMISDLETKRDETLKILLQWAEQQGKYDTKYVNYGFFDYKQQLKDQYEEQIKKLEGELKVAKTEKDQADQKLTNANDRINSMQSQLDAMKYVTVTIRDGKQYKYEIIFPYLPAVGCMYDVYERPIREVRYPGYNWCIEWEGEWHYTGRQSINYNVHKKFDVTKEPSNEEKTEQRRIHD